MKYVKKYGFAFYLGASISLFADIDILNWEFYAIVIPTFIFIEISKDEY